MPDTARKVSIIGAGNVGVRYAYALMIENTAREIVLVDVARDRLEGEVMDLSHGAPYIRPVKVTAGDYADIRGSDLVVITAGAGQKPGQSRLDLIKANVELYRKIIPEIERHAPAAVYLVVTNPVDALSYAAHRLSSKQPHEIVGSGTVLDTARFRYLLGRHCMVDSRNVHAYVLGEHGDSEVAIWSRVMIGGLLLGDYCPICDRFKACAREEELERVFVEVRDSAYDIIERKGETSYGIGLALVRITRAILNDENSILPVSSLMQGYLGMADLYLSMPAIVNRKGVEKVLEIKLSGPEEKALKHSAAVLRNAIRQTGIER